MKHGFSQKNKAKIDDFDRESFWKQVNSAYEALRNDPIAWQKELEERSAWDVTLADGIDKRLSEEKTMKTPKNIISEIQTKFKQIFYLISQRKADSTIKIPNDLKAKYPEDINVIMVVLFYLEDLL